MQTEARPPPARTISNTLGADEGRGATVQKAECACMTDCPGACNQGCRTGGKIACDHARYLRSGQWPRSAAMTGRRRRVAFAKARPNL